MDASIKRYFAQNRDRHRLLDDYDDRTSSSSRRETAASQIVNGRMMLERFAKLDASEPPPTRHLVRPTRAPVLGIGITMGVDLAYETSSGWLLRLLLTDDQIRRPEHLRLYATAAAVHFQGRGDGGPVARIEIWLLRFEGRIVGWPKSLLDISVPRLETRLDEILRGGPA